MADMPLGVHGNRSLESMSLERSKRNIEQVSQRILSVISKTEDTFLEQHM